MGSRRSPWCVYLVEAGNVTRTAAASIHSSFKALSSNVRLCSMRRLLGALAGDEADRDLIFSRERSSIISKLGTLAKGAVGRQVSCRHRQPGSNRRATDVERDR